jgi:hypothetical protein
MNPTTSAAGAIAPVPFSARLSRTLARMIIRRFIRAYFGKLMLAHRLAKMTGLWPAALPAAATLGVAGAATAVAATPAPAAAAPQPVQPVPTANAAGTGNAKPVSAAPAGYGQPSQPGLAPAAGNALPMPAATASSGANGAAKPVMGSFRVTDLIALAQHQQQVQQPIPQPSGQFQAAYR